MGDLATSRAYIAGCGATAPATVAFGGNPNRNNTEEFTISLSATTAASWASGGNMSTARVGLGGFGTQTAGAGAGGYTYPGFTRETEEYNGTSWSDGGDLAHTDNKYGLMGAGTQTAGLAFGGGAGTTVYGQTDEYDGSSWTASNAMNTEKIFGSGGGTQTAGLSAGGEGPGAGSNTADTEEYNGTSWSEQNNMSTARRGCGVSYNSQTAALVVGGFSSTRVTSVEEYDGTNWSSGGAYPTALNAIAGFGTSSDFIAFAGSAPSSQSLVSRYDGTAFASAPSLPTANNDMDSSAASPADSGLGFGGNDPSRANSYEWTGETTAARAVKTIDFD